MNVCDGSAYAISPGESAMNISEKVSTKPNGISVVVPVFDEEHNLESLVSRLRETLENIGLPYEIVLVDDGSNDWSFTVIERLHNVHGEVKGVKFIKHYGKATAYRAGFELASYPSVVTIDADIQEDPGEIPKLLAQLNKGYDLVSGWRVGRTGGVKKRLPSRIYNLLTSLLCGVRLHDHNCGLKAYKSEVTKSLCLSGQLHRFIPALAHSEGFRISEVKVAHRERLYGRSKYGMMRLITGSLDLLKITLWVRFGVGKFHNKDTILSKVAERVLD